MNPQVDAYLAEATAWRPEMERLRKIILDFPLTEELKWGKPCYTLDGGNILIIQPFKAYCALMFCKGALLKDARRILVKPGENTQGARQMRFTELREIKEAEAVMRAYIREAIAAEKAGLEVKYKKNPEPVPEELRRKLDQNPALKAAFAKLTPGRQRGYILHISAAKQSQTREARIEKHAPRILQGKGMTD